MFYVWCVCLHVYMEKKYQGNKEMKDEKLMSKLKSVEIHLQLQSSCIKEAVVPVSRATEASSLNDAIDSLALKKTDGQAVWIWPSVYQWKSEYLWELRRCEGRRVSEKPRIAPQHNTYHNGNMKLAEEL